VLKIQTTLKKDLNIIDLIFIFTFVAPLATIAAQRARADLQYV